MESGVPVPLASLTRKSAKLEHPMTISPTQHRVLSWLLTYGPAGSATIAEAHGVGQATAQTHLYRLQLAGVVRRYGLGRKARWQAQTIDESPLSRTDQPNPIWQCPSVWVYAARVAAANRGGRVSP